MTVTIHKLHPDKSPSEGNAPERGPGSPHEETHGDEDCGDGGDVIHIKIILDGPDDSDPLPPEPDKPRRSW